MVRELLRVSWLSFNWLSFKPHNDILTVATMGIDGHAGELQAQKQFVEYVVLMSKRCDSLQRLHCATWSVRPSRNLFQCIGRTRTRASVRLVHAAISSLVAMSGYRFRWNVASSSCSCWLVKCVRCRRCRFGLAWLPLAPPPPCPVVGPPSSSTAVMSDCGGRPLPLP